MTWKLSGFAPKSQVQGALLAHEEIDDWDFELTISGREIAEDRPQEWVLEAWYPRRPGKPQKDALRTLFDGDPPEITVEKILDQDWLTLSQKGVKPIRAGPFHVHTRDYPSVPDAIDLTIPASQAFGTGQHETTAGCLEMLARMKGTGAHPRRIADIGTGTGLLAMAAIALWPAAFATASDIDPVCAGVVEENAALNSVELGTGRGALSMIVAPGMDDELLRLRGPYDLLIANILAGPLIDLAPDFARSTTPGGNALLAGLLAGEQEDRVMRAYRRAGFRLAQRAVNGDWAILWLRKRRGR
ncbi:MAG: 50S ribosomal protein L11 methyltransferase [Erythrobacter sp.]|uniref:50S ribosomal protein L11 methyltransferase n=1 Tax=Erythrobacter sp. TaxID=1042 RepID=UPI003C75E69F